MQTMIKLKYLTYFSNCRKHAPIIKLKLDIWTNILLYKDKELSA